MSAADLAAVLVTVVAFASFVVLILTVQRLVHSLRDLRASVDVLQRETVPMLEELRAVVRDAGAEVERVDHLLEAAETISATVDSASRLSYLAFRAPLIRTVAFVKGMGRFLRRLVGLGGRGARAGSAGAPRPVGRTSRRGRRAA